MEGINTIQSAHDASNSSGQAIAGGIVRYDGDCHFQGRCGRCISFMVVSSGVETLTVFVKKLLKL